MVTCILTHAVGRTSIPHPPTPPFVARYGLVAYEYIALVTVVGDLCAYLCVVSGGSPMFHYRQGRTGVLILTYRRGRDEYDLSDNKGCLQSQWDRGYYKVEQYNKHQVEVYN